MKLETVKLEDSVDSATAKVRAGKEFAVRTVHRRWEKPDKAVAMLEVKERAVDMDSAKAAVQSL